MERNVEENQILILLRRPSFVSRVHHYIFIYTAATNKTGGWVGIADDDEVKQNSKIKQKLENVR
jgi:hypothetical protein